MDKEKKKMKKISESEKGGAAKTPPFSSRIEEEGEKLIAYTFERLGKYIPEDRKKTVEDLRLQSQKFLAQLSHSIEESHKKAVERLHAEAKTHWRDNINDQISKGLAKFDIVTRKDIEPLFNDLKKLRREVNALRKTDMLKKRVVSQKPAEA